mmetsp:Transcript_65280/g.187826  ORF Transcript_65280/g.187826 Transcript_65280/m.187826 type:complete len:220 (+) Transcript_65280:79-738(+)|eukprot:CAMPEP_0177165184 /NCGR_PEP_ID=MMETSP0367-20130122/7359_1 /TAXON_ID=447022 ORGANISM="Scrippsiella hangoei-like, Strain SHHI-4" /NCGR_SAMPLE_ID=MMETSP0367 /ASSEMBLY_ACC=CAM_ASM_000362 /LENGTH=219 /DNA_ID=CAMNT_0018611157 /DNA_START=64 /DNA_END=723 /DNA_ORIENTATION=+
MSTAQRVVGLLVMLAGSAVGEDGSRQAWSSTAAQAKYMRRCIELAQEAQAKGGAPYGALVVDPKVGIIAEGHNHGAQNPIWHGEMAAIANLSDIIRPRTFDEVAAGLEMYTSAEPCPMCMSAIVWSGFGKVVYGTSIPFIAKHGGYQIMIRASHVIRKSSKHILLDGGVLANETDSLYAQGAAHQHIGDEDHDESDRAWFQEKFHAKANAPQDSQIYFM